MNSTLDTTVSDEAGAVASPISQASRTAARNTVARMSRFTGKVAVTTGSTHRIGFATAKRLGQEGAKVVVSSRRQTNVTEAVQRLTEMGIQAAGIVCHQGNEEDRKRLIDHAISTFGGIDLLFVGAGVNPIKGDMFDVTEEQWDKTFQVNLKSTFLLIRDVVPHMAKRGGGAIMTNCTAGAYRLGTFPTTRVSVYAISKLAVISMMKVLAHPCSDMNIRINAIAPGPVNTHFLKAMVGQDVSEFIGKSFCKYLKRCAEADECGSVAAFLLSDDASFITGDCVTVCGGFSHRL